MRAMKEVAKAVLPQPAADWIRVHVLKTPLPAPVRAAVTVPQLGKVLRKEEFAFVPHTDPRLVLEGAWERRGELAIGRGDDARVLWVGEEVELVFLVESHRWSAVAVVARGEAQQAVDLYHWAAHAVAVPVPAGTGPVSLAVHSTNRAAEGTEIVLRGVFMRKAAQSGPPPLEVTQAVMNAQVDRWTENIIASGRKVEDVVAQRHAAYLLRWREVRPYIQPGAHILDIGCGNFWTGLFEEIQSLQPASYTGFDIDARVIENDSGRAQALGLTNFRFQEGVNDDLPFPESSIDFVFSSHSIEHSPDLARTFTAVRRILKKGSYFFFAVPLDVDLADEHQWIISKEQWIRLPHEFGFEVRNVHIGNVYPEQGYDLAIVAQAV